MCGRYYVDDDTAKEIERMVQKVSETFSHKGDVYPTQKPPIMYQENQLLTGTNMIWGFENPKGKGVLINARSETVTEKYMFRDALQRRRCIIPAAGFYEWDHSKNKVRFLRKDASILYMAGIWTPSQEGNRFVILTTAANASISKVHHRMPVILEENQIKDWIFQESFTETALHKRDVMLEHIKENEQLSFL